MRTAPAALLVLALAAACGSDRPPAPGACTRDADCSSREACKDGTCTPLPCGGCGSDQLCGSAGACVSAQGAPCPTSGCPVGYTCTAAGACGKQCTRNAECGSLKCSAASGTCAQCEFNTDCAAVAGKPRCDGRTGACVECTANADCVTRLGPSHYCDPATLACKQGCLSNDDCDLNRGEKCDGASGSSPGRCLQCKVRADCPTATPACDPNGRCVACVEDGDCPLGAPRCDKARNACVQCLPANDASGADCGCGVVVQASGYTCSPTAVPRDPHNAAICWADSFSCGLGCTTDANCGCPRDPATGRELDCVRKPGAGPLGAANLGAEHCDLSRSKDADGRTSRGACVECTANTHCRHRIAGGSAEYGAGLANLYGARCVDAACKEGCDADADCPSGSTCDTTAKKCVQCSCRGKPVFDAGGASAGFCDHVAVGGVGPGCGMAGGAQLVCDATTDAASASFGKCRKKRQGEACARTAECGDSKDPTVGLCPPAMVCAFSSKSGTSGSAAVTWCAADRASGRCAVACNNFNANQCASGVSCPAGSTCRQPQLSASDPASSFPAACVSSACNLP